MSSSAKRTNILIIEDDPLEAEHLKLHLQKAGHRVVAITDTGEAAIKRAEQGDVDFMIADVMLAGDIDGIETVRRIHEKHNIPTIFVTSYFSDDLLLRAEQSRPFAYLLKPYRQLEMEFLIKMSLTRTQQDNELAEQKKVAEETRQLLQKELLEQEQSLRQSQKMDAIGNLTSGVAHDYNNMLGIILGYAELLKEELQGQPKLLKYALEIVQAGERGAKLTGKLLAFSRQKTSDAEILDINDTLLSLQDMLKKTLTARITLKYELTENLWPVFLDGSNLVDAIVNISINAMHAIEGQGQINIQTHNQHINATEANNLLLSPGDYVQLIITDTGRGMDEATKQQIFEPFFSTKGEKGTGLGLSQVYGFVQSNGAINVNSELGKGAQFELYFPRFYTSNDKVPLKEEINVIDVKGNETILIIDDESALLNLLSEILGQQGYTTFCAEDAKQGLDILENESIDLMISDIIMPKMDGYELAALVREKYPDIKIQLVSGFSNTSNVGRVDADLSKKILKKPYNAKTLLKNIRQLLDQ